MARVGPQVGGTQALECLDHAAGHQFIEPRPALLQGNGGHNQPETGGQVLAAGCPPFLVRLPQFSGCGLLGPLLRKQLQIQCLTPSRRLP